MELSPGLTAIVGPNGSGKSNLADAVAWVLGEQALSALRIKRSRDLIHQPVNGLSAPNLVEVQISIENSEDSLPLEGHNFDINRVGYRDGESEYRLNGHRTRLTQIREMLAPFGLAKRSFSLIRQGHCDQFLTVSPAQRRRIVEEAAGALGLIHKKQAAERRLARISEHLAPVHQELRDLQLSLSHMERQARQFERRRQLMQELRTAMAQFYLPAFQAVQARLARASRDLAAVRCRQDAAEASFQQQRLSASQLQSQAHILDGQLATTQQSLSQAEERYVALMSKTQVLAERERNLRRLLHQNQGRQKSEGDALALSESNLNRHRRVRAVLEDQTWQLEQELYQLEQEAARQQKTRDQHQQAQVRIEAELKGCADTQGDLQSEQSMLLWQQQQEEAAAQRQEDELQQAKAERLQIGNSLAHEQAEIERCTRQQAMLDGQLAALQKAAAETRRALQKQQRAVSDLGTQQSRRQARRDYLAEISKQGAAPFANVPGMERSLGQLAALLHVEPGHQASVAACLGDWQFSYVFRTWAEAMQVWQGVQEANIATELRLAVLEAVSDKALAELADAALLPVVQAVSGASEIRKLVGCLLAHSALAQNAQDAVARFSSGQGGRLAFVATLQGDRITEPGLVRVKSTGNRQESLLHVAHEMRELDSELQDLSRQQEMAQTQTEDAAAQLASAERDVRNMRMAVQDIMLAVQRKRHGVQLTQERHESLGNAIENLELAHGTRSKTTRKRTERLAEIRDAMAQIGPRTVALQHALDEHGKTMQQLGQEERTTALTELQARKSAQSQELEAARILETQEAGRCDDLAASVQQLQTEAAALDEDWTRLQDEQKVAARSLAAAELQVHAWREELSPLALAKQQLDLKRTAQTEAFVQDRESHHELETRRHQLELLQAEMTERQNWLQRTLRQDVELCTNGPVTDTEAGEFLQSLETSTSDSPHPVDEPELDRLRRGIHRCGQVDPDLYLRFQAAQDRHRLLEAQTSDLDKSEADLRKVISQLEQELNSLTQLAFAEINNSFGEYFGRFFPGGKGWLALQREEGELEPGMELHVHLQGQRPQSIAALSGGERAMTAIAFLYALLKFNRPPFCVLDEIDAALDESNVGRIGSSLRELAQHTQFILITHNQHMLEYADSIFGVTKNAEGISQLLSMELHNSRFA